MSASTRVLVASVNPDTAMHLLGWLTKHGFYVALEGDVVRMSDVSNDLPAPDCLLLDDALGANVLPHLVSSLRARPGWADTVIAVIGTFSEMQEVALFEAGADDVVSKPLRSTALVQRMRHHLGARHA